VIPFQSHRTTGMLPSWPEMHKNRSHHLLTSASDYGTLMGNHTFWVEPNHSRDDWMRFKLCLVFVAWSQLWLQQQRCSYCKHSVLFTVTSSRRNAWPPNHKSKAVRPHWLQIDLLDAVLGVVARVVDQRGDWMPGNRVSRPNELHRLNTTITSTPQTSQTSFTRDVLRCSVQCRAVPLRATPLCIIPQHATYVDTVTKSHMN